jgi:uncharacterized membrane protein
MNLAHLHLLLNHWPIIGTFIAAGLFFVALMARSDDLKQVSLALFALMALMAIPAYVTGHIAQDRILSEPGVSESLISTHQGAALLAFAALALTGTFAWAGLWQYRRASRLPGWTVAAVLACSLLTLSLMVVTGNTGGAIRHPEILSNEPATSVVGTIGARVNASIEYVVTGSARSVWPVLEVFHFVGLALLIGATGVLHLRLLGFYKQLPAGPFHRFIPWGLAGLGINVVTGMLFFLGMPFFYVYNADFLLKILAVVLAGASLLLLCTSAFRDCELLEAGQDAPLGAKVLAASSLMLWVTVIVLGRYMPLFEDTLDPRYTLPP